MNTGNRVFVTGVGTVNSAADSITQFVGLEDIKKPSLMNIDQESFYPFLVKAFPEYNLLCYLKKKSELRSLGEGQRLACFAAGKALDSAGLIENQPLLKKTAIMIASGSGERSDEIDESIIENCSEIGGNNNEILNYNTILSKLRPSLFLTQLPNLYAANISIVHGVTGSSLTFMGEESAAVDALEVSIQKIKNGQEDLILVGGAFNANQKFLHTYYGAANKLASVHDVDINNKMILGSSGAFLVLESERHAKSRSANLLAEINVEERTDYSTKITHQLLSDQFPNSYSDIKDTYIIGDLDFQNLNTDHSMNKYSLCSQTLRGSCFEAAPFTDIIFGTWSLVSKQCLSTTESGIEKHRVDDLDKVLIYSRTDDQCASLISLRKAYND